MEQNPSKEQAVDVKPKKLTCYRKETFETMQLAVDATKYYTQHEAVAYQCKWCKKFHYVFT